MQPDMAPVEILDFFERTWIYDTETWLDRMAERPWTMIHGDYEFDNMAYAADGPVVFDWQTPMKSFPGGDLAWFLGLGATEESVAEERAVLDSYRAALAAAGGPDWSRDELLDDAAASLQFHCTSAACTLNSVIAAGAPTEEPNPPTVPEDARRDDGLRGTLERARPGHGVRTCLSAPVTTT